MLKVWVLTTGGRQAIQVREGTTGEVKLRSWVERFTRTWDGQMGKVIGTARFDQPDGSTVVFDCASVTGFVFPPGWSS